MTDRNSPRHVTRRFFLIVTMWTVTLTIPAVLTLFDRMDATGGTLLQANDLVDVISAVLSALLCLGMLLAILLPGKPIGYRLAALVLRLYNVFWLTLMGVLGLAFVALAVVACMQIITVPMALGALLVIAVAAACMTLTALYAHHLAECLKELSISARAGVWQKPTGYKAPIPGMTIAMTCLTAVILLIEWGCAAYPADAAALFQSLVDAVYHAAPTGARTLVRTMGDSLRPMLDVSMTQVVGRLMTCVRYLFILLTYREYMRMNATFKDE